LAALVRQGADLSAKEVVQTLRQGLQEFTNGQPLADDTTILVAKMNGQDQVAL
jgi:serine phosphatase RsbU (regulator of sigma subunit)